eukprot:6161991-Pyramimonas_sp.AAC.1
MAGTARLASWPRACGCLVACDTRRPRSGSASTTWSAYMAPQASLVTSQFGSRRPEQRRPTLSGLFFWIGLDRSREGVRFQPAGKER